VLSSTFVLVLTYRKPYAWFPELKSTHFKFYFLNLVSGPPSLNYGFCCVALSNRVLATVVWSLIHFSVAAFQFPISSMILALYIL